MIGYLIGTLRAKRDRFILLEVSGVGYKVTVPKPLWEKLEVHASLELYIHTIVREDELSLYGFEKEADLKLFELLLTISGIGPRLAIDLLTWPIEKIKTAILSKDVASLTQLPGIGKKTAERIILELREKLGALDSNHLPELEEPISSEWNQDVMMALENLGYHRRDIHRVFRSLKEPLEKSEEMIRYFLKNV